MYSGDICFLRALLNLNFRRNTEGDKSPRPEVIRRIDLQEKCSHFQETSDLQSSSTN